MILCWGARVVQGLLFAPSAICMSSRRERAAVTCARVSPELSRRPHTLGQGDREVSGLGDSRPLTNMKRGAGIGCRVRERDGEFDLGCVKCKGPGRHRGVSEVLGDCHV